MLQKGMTVPVVPGVSTAWEKSTRFATLEGRMSSVSKDENDRYLRRRQLQRRQYSGNNSGGECTRCFSLFCDWIRGILCHHWPTVRLELSDPPLNT